MEICERFAWRDLPETQIFELLSRRSPLPQHEDVLAVLASIDPPESYVPEDLREPGEQPRLAQDEAVWRQLPDRAVRLVVKLIPIVAGIVALVIVNCVVITILIASENVIPWLVTLGALAWANYAGVRRFRAWSATRRGDFLSDLRQSLAAWLMPKEGAPAT